MTQQVDAARIIARLQNELAQALTRAVIAEERAEQAEQQLTEQAEQLVKQPDMAEPETIA